MYNRSRNPEWHFVKVIVWTIACSESALTFWSNSEMAMSPLAYLNLLYIFIPAHNLRKPTLRPPRMAVLRCALSGSWAETFEPRPALWLSSVWSTETTAFVRNFTTGRLALHCRPDYRAQNSLYMDAHGRKSVIALFSFSAQKPDALFIWPQP